MLPAAGASYLKIGGLSGPETQPNGMPTWPPSRTVHDDYEDPSRCCSLMKSLHSVHVLYIPAAHLTMNQAIAHPLDGSAASLKAFNDGIICGNNTVYVGINSMLCTPLTACADTLYLR